MLKRLPEEAKTILGSLETTECYVEDFTSQYMGWTMDVTIGSRSFNLVMEWHQVYVSEVTENGKNQIWPRQGDSKQELEYAAQAINSKIAQQSHAAGRQ